MTIELTIETKTRISSRFMGASSGDFSAITSQVGSSNISQSPLPQNGNIEFYRPPVSGVPFADGSHQEIKHDCTDYLMAKVFPDQIAVFRVPKLPRFFENTDNTAATRFPNATEVGRTLSRNCSAI